MSARSPRSELLTLQELHSWGIAFDSLHLLPRLQGLSIPDPTFNELERFLWQKVEYAVAAKLDCFVDDSEVVLELFWRFAPQICAIPVDERHALEEFRLD